MSRFRNKGFALVLAMAIVAGLLGISATSEAATTDWAYAALYLGYSNTYLQPMNYYSILTSFYYSSDYCSYAKSFTSVAATYAYYAYLYSYYGYLGEYSNSNAKNAYENAYYTYLYNYYANYYADYSCSYNYYNLVDAVAYAAHASQYNFLAAGYAYSCYYR